METAKIEEGTKLLQVKKDLEKRIEKLKTSLIDDKIGQITLENSNGYSVLSIRNNKEFIKRVSELYLSILEGTLKELDLKILAL